MIPTTEITSIVALDNFVSRSSAGDTCIYHRGLLAADRDRSMSWLQPDRRALANAIGGRAWGHKEVGLLLLAQRRVEGMFEYIAIRSKRGAVPRLSGVQ